MEIDFKGTGVAIVTPFNEDKSIDFIGLSNLIEYLIDGGVEFLVSMGTTGESAVLNKDEKNKIVAFTKNKINSRVPFILGIGGNNTSNVVAQIKSTDFSGIDAILSVSPAYNKPTQEGFTNILKQYLKLARQILFYIMFPEEHLQTCLLRQH